MTQLGYGLIGLGRISSRHVAGVQALAEGRVAAVADTNLEKAEQVAGKVGEGCAAYADYRDLLADDAVDVAVVLVPTHLHCEVSVAAMDAGRHVMCEKAMAPSVRECLDMIEARDRNGVKLMIAHSTRFQPPYRTARGRAKGRRRGGRPACCGEVAEVGPRCTATQRGALAAVHRDWTQSPQRTFAP